MLINIHRVELTHAPLSIRAAKREIRLVYDSRQLSPYRIVFLHRYLPSFSGLFSKTYSLTPAMFIALLAKLGEPDDTFEGTTYIVRIYNQN